MSTIKVDTIQTRTGSGNIAVSNALSGTDIISTANITNNAVTAGKLASTLDLSSNTLTMPTGHRTLSAVHGVTEPQDNTTSFVGTVNYAGHGSAFTAFTKTFTPTSSSSFLLISYVCSFYKASQLVGFMARLKVNGSYVVPVGGDNGGHFGSKYKFHRSGSVPSASMHAEFSGQFGYFYNSSAACTVAIDINIYDESTNSGVGINPNTNQPGTMTIFEFGAS